MASLLDLLGLGPNVAPWFPPAGSEVPPVAPPPPPPIAEAAPAIQEGPFERLMREAQQLPATDIYRQGVGLPPSAKVPSPDFNAPLPGLGPSWRDQFTPGLATAKGLIGGALEPFGQAGRLMTGASQDVSGDLAGVLAAATPMGRIGGLAKAGLKVADDGLKINIAPHGMEVPEWGKGLTWGLTAYRTKVKGEDAIHVRDARVPPDMQGQGLGTAMYEHAADLAAKEGKPLLSDGTVTQDAANRWMALNRAGHNVVMNPDKRFVPGPPEAPHLGRFETPDGSPVFRVEPKDKEAGTLSDFIKAYHGSPHDFDRFDLSKIGTGEGAQAYGHGLYFAENEGVAKQYKTALQGKNTDWNDPASIAGHFFALGGDNHKNAANLLQSFISRPKPGYDRAALEGAQRLLQKGGELPPPKVGKMYQVAIKANPEHFLDWDKPLSQQSPKVQDAIKGLNQFGAKVPAKNNVGAETTGGQLVDYLERRYGSKQDATADLREFGIPGIKYLDQGSRANTALEVRQHPEGWIATDISSGKQTGPFKTWQEAKASHQTRNFVVFDDKLIDILKKYGIAGIGALPAMNAYHYQDQQ